MSITATLEQPQTAAPIDVYARTLPFIIERHSFGEHRKADMSLLEIHKASEADTDTDKRLITLTKRLLNSDVTRAVSRHDTQFRQYLTSVSATPLRPGVFLIPFGLVEEVHRKAREWEAERDRLADIAAEAYPALIAPMRSSLGSLWNPDDYPSQDRFRAAYWSRWRFVDMGVPNVLREFNASVFAEERRKLAQESRDAAEQIQQHLCASLMEITSHLSDLLAPRANGRKPALRDGSLDGLKHYLSVLEIRDVTNYAQLREVVRRLRSGLGEEGVDVQALRNDASLRAVTAAELALATQSLEALVMVDAPRAIHLRDEEVA